MNRDKKFEEVYKLRARDFIPIIGLADYDERTSIADKKGEESLSPRNQARLGLLALYNCAVGPTVVALIWGVKGLEALIK